MRTAIFIERDGVLNLPKVEGQYQIAPRVVTDLAVNRAALEPLKRLKQAGFMLIGTTNQPGISRGHISRREIDLMHTILMKAFPLDEIVMCPHDDADRCPCRKPKPGLFREAAFNSQLLLDHCFVISDKWQDAKAAQNAGCTSLLIESPWNGSGHHDFIVPDLASAASKVLQLQHSNSFALANA
ncbi:MAG TPA: HAD-IIIA family hydrolase [Verrucomicrobiae bacterium]|nr:HAD-IIIA family hydrolase [Verrucomicrobiae bacterium]